MKSTTLDEVGAILRAAAAAVVMPRYASLQLHETEMKAAGEPVTIADREAETMIGDALLALLPEARLIGEEASSANPSLLRNLDEGMAWIIDPIDGTANFASGRPPFAMMVALAQRGEAIASWILDPLTGRLSVAERGAGAWIDGQRISHSAEPIEPSEMSGIVSEAFVPAESRDIINDIKRAVGEVRSTARCAGHEYPQVAAGACQFALYWRTLVWDHAPGALLLTEAGGKVTRLDGTPYRLSTPRGGLLLAHNPLISSSLLELVRARA